MDKINIFKAFRQYFQNHKICGFTLQVIYFANLGNRFFFQFSKTNSHAKTARKWPLPPTVKS